MHILVVEDERALCDTLIYRMLFNLIENAIRYSRPDSRFKFLSAKRMMMFLSGLRTTASAYPNSTRRAFFSRSSVSINHAAESTAESA